MKMCTPTARILSMVITVLITNLSVAEDFPDGDTSSFDIVDKLAVGGNLKIQWNAAAARTDRLSDTTTTFSPQASLYFDLKENDTRTFLRIRWENSPVEVEELKMQFNLGDCTYWTLGRQKIKFGSGKFWNPTDFLNSETRDPFASIDERLGKDLLKAHLPIDQANIYAVIPFESTETLGEAKGYLRGEIVVGAAEFALSWYGKRSDGANFGADLSLGLGRFDLHSAIAIQKESDETLKIDEHWFVQAVGGASLEVGYGDNNSFTLTGEYFYNDKGYADNNNYQPALIAGSHQLFSLAKQYVMGSLFLPKPLQWDEGNVTWFLINNLNDGSMHTRAQISFSLAERLTMEAFAGWFDGTSGSEMRLAQRQWEAGWSLAGNL